MPRARGTGRPRVRPAKLAADKGYRLPGIRRHLACRGIGAVIPTRKDPRVNPRFARELYRRRHGVERGVGWRKENRRLATRHEKLALSYLAVVHLAMPRRCLRLLEPSDRT